METLANINWENINLDEWLGLLAPEGMFAGDGAFDLESLTGVDSALEVGDRLNAEERTASPLRTWILMKLEEMHKIS